MIQVITANNAAAARETCIYNEISDLKHFKRFVITKKAANYAAFIKTMCD